MRKSFTRISSWILMLAMAMTISLDIAALPVVQKNDSTYLHLQKFNRSKSSYLKNNVRIAFPTIKTVPVNIVKTQQPADEKVLSNVEVYPNPVTDQLNLKYTVSRNANVSIKVVDILGNEVINFSRRVDPGDQKFVYNLSNKLNSGFYFVRVVSGTESVIKRISVL